MTRVTNLKPVDTNRDTEADEALERAVADATENADDTGQMTAIEAELSDDLKRTKARIHPAKHEISAFGDRLSQIKGSIASRRTFLETKRREMALLGEVIAAEQTALDEEAAVEQAIITALGAMEAMADAGGTKVK